MSERVSSASRGSDRLAARRRVRRRRFLIALGILFLLLCAGVLYELRQSTMRIATIQVFGADESFANIARASMAGSYLGIIPRDSIFFFPSSRIRSDIIAAHPDIAAISIFRNGFSSISIKVNDRVPIARWCGTPSASSSPKDSLLKEVTQAAAGDCFLFDASGFVYTTTTDPVGISADAQSNLNKPLTPFVLYSSLQNGEESPIGATLANANQIPRVFDFARQIESFGPPVTTVVIRGDEVDFFLASALSGSAQNVRITYLFGDEQNAFAALVSAKDQLNLSDATLQYVDLRFPGKIYLKRSETPK